MRWAHAKTSLISGVPRPLPRDPAYAAQGIRRRDLRSAGIAAEKDDLILPLEPPPTRNGVGLNALDMLGKYLGYREDARHRSPMPY